MEYYYLNYEQKEQHLRRLGMEMHKLEITIYSGRQVLKALRIQEPLDSGAVAEQYDQIRSAHGQHHVVARELVAAKATHVDILGGAPKPWR